MKSEVINLTENGAVRTVSMKPPRRSPSLNRSWLSTIASGALKAAVAAGLVAAGMYWKEPISHLFGATSAHAQEGERTGSGKKQLWTCGMHPQVIQDHPGDCPICHMKLTPLQQDAEDSGSSQTERKISYWWDPMIGPASISDKPGKSTMGMDLVPVYDQDVSGGTAVKIDPVVVQNMGVRVATVERGPIQQTFRAVGYLEEAQPLIHDVNLRVSGWIEKLYAATEGQHVEQGAPLFELYSPEVQVAVQELIAARKSAASLQPQADDFASETSQTLVQSSRDKLTQWGLDEAQIKELASLDRAPRTVTFRSPITGHITMKNVVEGASVKAGDRVLQLVDHSTLWLDAQVFEQDLPFVRLGQTVTATVAAMPGLRLEAKVIFIHPHLDAATRTATVRVELPNPNLSLRPGMYATVEISSRLTDDAVVVPREAIIDSGTRSIAFVSTGNGRFEPRNLTLGVSGEGGSIEVLKGLAPGETVVTSGQFLLDSESRMKEAIQRHLSQQLLMQPAADQGMKDMPGMAKQSTTAPATADAGTPAADRGMMDMPGMANMQPSVNEPASVPTTQSGGDRKLAWTTDVDNVYSAYLDIARQLAAQADGKPLDVKPLAVATQRLVDVTTGPQAELPRKILNASAALDGKSLEDQRKAFKGLSDAVISMIAVCPPSDALGKQLFVAHCPMAFGDGADWLQTSEQIANPYLTDMRTCGSVKRTVATTPKDKK